MKYYIQASYRHNSLYLRNEPTDIGLCVQAIFRPNFSPRTTNFINITKMTTMPLPLDFDHEKDYEIETKYKEVIY